MPHSERNQTAFDDLLSEKVKPHIHEKCAPQGAPYKTARRFASAGCFLLHYCFLFFFKDSVRDAPSAPKAAGFTPCRRSLRQRWCIPALIFRLPPDRLSGSFCHIPSCWRSFRSQAFRDGSLHATYRQHSL